MHEIVSEPGPSTERVFSLTSQEKEALLGLEDPLANILEKLRPELERGEYRLIIGDDASGRIPTRIVGEVIKKLSEERGFPRPLVRFIAGSTFMDQNRRSEKI